MRRPRPVAPPRLPPGPRRTLKALLHELYLAADTPAYGTVADWAGAWDEDQPLPAVPSKDTVGRCLGAGLPSRDMTVSVALLLANRAGWDLAEVVRQVGQLWLAARRMQHVQLYSITDWSPTSLGVHEAIDLDARGGVSDGVREPLLTPYLVRPHDEDLRQRLRAASDGRSIFAMLVGWSSTGKTRAMYEGVKAILPDWPLLSPSTADELQEWATTDSIDPKTVLWLDEAQHYLGAAGAILHLMNHVPHLAFIGSMWPSHADPLLARPGQSIEAEQDADRHARRLFAGGRNLIWLQDAVDLSQMRELRSLADGDRRVEAALEAGEADGLVIQHLTGGPELVDRYERGAFSPLERAVITAALDARRLGHARPIPAAMLGEAVGAVLPGRLRVRDSAGGIEAVLAGLCDPERRGVKGALTPLVGDRLSPGFGLPDGYHPASYLDQHARNSRRFEVPGDWFWLAAGSHACSSDDVVALADSALRRLRFRIAATLYRIRVEAGDTRAILRLANLYHEIGLFAEAERFLRRAAEGGEVEALNELARRCIAREDYVEAERLSGLAATRGDREVLWSLAQHREAHGDSAEAERLAELSEDAGRAWNLRQLAGRRENAGDLAGAERAYRLAAAREPSALSSVARVVEHDGRYTEAELLARSAARAGGHSAWSFLVEHREELGDHAAADRLALAAADAGQTQPLNYLALRRDLQGDFEAAEGYAAQAADRGDPSSLLRLAHRRKGLGDPSDVIRLAQRAAGAGSERAARLLVELHCRAGHHTAAEQLATQAASTDGGRQLAHLACVYDSIGRHADAERFAILAAKHGSSYAAATLAVARDQSGDPSTAVRLAMLAGSRGLEQLAWSRDDAGDHVGAEGLLRRADTIEMDDDHLLGLAHRWSKVGRTAEAARLYSEAGRRGSTHPYAMAARAVTHEEAGETTEADYVMRQTGRHFAVIEVLARIRQQRGDMEGYERLLKFAISLWDVEVVWALVDLLEDSGQRGEAEKMAELAARAGMTFALDMLVRKRGEAGRLVDAERLARLAADAGIGETLIAFAANQSADRRWTQLLRYGLAADGSTSDPWQAD
jgi:hypothetical protein